MRFTSILIGALGSLVAGASLASDLALIIRNESYASVRDANLRIDVDRVENAFEAAGYDVISLQNLPADRLQERIFELRPELINADRLVLFLGGHVVTNGAASWLLGTDARQVTNFDVGRYGLPLDALNRFLAPKQGAALMLVASPDSQRFGGAFELGYLSDHVPQGVTVLAGRGAALEDVLVEDILGGTPVGQALENRSSPSLAGYGFLPLLVPFHPLSGPDRADAARTAWATAERLATREAYEDYLSRFPGSPRSDEARARIEDLSLSPEAQAQAAEDALGLDREDRRSLQRALSILGYDPRGIDGIFGRGTRTALAGWQRDVRVDETGYLTAVQVARLLEQARVRQAELEAEAQRRQEEADREDTAYWRATGRGETEDGLRRYMERYPDGLFSDLALARLETLEADRRASAASEERLIWEDARARDTIEGYENYLARYPSGTFENDATIRLGQLRNERGNSDQVERARAQEARVLVNPISRVLVERRLTQLGLNPGEPDGTFDRSTRKAIRNFQRARNLPVTGYVNQATLARLLSTG